MVAIEGVHWSHRKGAWFLQERDMIHSCRRGSWLLQDGNMVAGGGDMVAAERGYGGCRRVT
jgi:hypothetical protein